MVDHRRGRIVCLLVFTSLDFGINYGIGKEDAMRLRSSLILCLIAVIDLGLLPSVFGLAKAEKDIVVSGNDTTFYNKGLALPIDKSNPIMICHRYLCLILGLRLVFDN
jgi:hypothetical protein